VFLAAVILLLGCIEVASSGSGWFCLHFDRILTWWLRCASGLQACSVSAPAADVVRLCSFSPLWAMVAGVFREESGMCRVSEPMVGGFFSQTCAASLNFERFAMKRCGTLRGFGAFFARSCDRFLLPFCPFSHFSLSFLIFLGKNSGWVFDKTVVLLGLAGYQMIVAGSALLASLVIYHFIDTHRYTVITLLKKAETAETLSKYIS